MATSPYWGTQVTSDQLNLLVDNSCKMSYSWDWKTSFIGDQELYRLGRYYIPSSVEDPFSYGQDVVQSKNRIRGRGTALAINLKSEANKTAKVLGLGVLYTG